MKSPIRNPNYDWTKIIPGDDSSLIWNEFYAFDDIPQVLNPESGYLFSANQNPFFVSAKKRKRIISVRIMNGYTITIN